MNKAEREQLQEMYTRYAKDRADGSMDFTLEEHLNQARQFRQLGMSPEKVAEALDVPLEYGEALLAATADDPKEGMEAKEKRMNNKPQERDDLKIGEGESHIFPDIEPPTFESLTLDNLSFDWDLEKLLPDQDWDELFKGMPSFDFREDGLSPLERCKRAFASLSEAERGQFILWMVNRKSESEKRPIKRRGRKKTNGD